MHRCIHDPRLVRMTSREFLDNAALPRNEDAIRKTENFVKIGRDYHNGNAASLRKE